MTEKENKSINDYFSKLEVRVPLFPDIENVEEFVDYSSFKNFIFREAEFWEDFKTGSLNSIRVRFDGLKNGFTIVEDNLSRTGIWQSHLKNIVDSIRTGTKNFVFSSTEIAIFLKLQYQKDANRAEGAYDYFFKEGVINTRSLSQRNFFLGFIDAYYFSEFDLNYKSKVAARKKSVAKLKEELLIAQNDMEGRYAEFSKGISEWEKEETEKISSMIDEKKTAFNDLEVDWNTKFTKIESLYNNKLRIEGPATYWEKTANEYNKKGRNWTIGALGLGAILVAILIVLLFNIPDWVTGATKMQNVRGAIIFAIVVSVGVYLVRLFVKLSLSSFHLSRDANERLQLSHVYLALLKDDEITETDRSIILQSLFSRSDTGLLRNEGSPTMPQAIFESITKKS